MWQIMLIVAILFLIIEIFMPAMFFLNLAIAAFITSIIALFTTNMELLIVSFVLLSLGALFSLRPFLLRKKDDKSLQTGIKDKYIGKIVKVIKPTDKFSGAITIYDERWEARKTGEDNEVIPIGAEVRIVRNESLVMYVEKI
ncbi:MAG: NfeD family protein [Candidatus Gastranaerophilales bacterium]|nr:NfeD family protein [Candidatus Gastranaerophilales bacterium]